MIGGTDELELAGGPQWFVVCNTDHPEVPRAPAGIERTHGFCADCSCGITWIGIETHQKSRLPHLCGRCALNRADAFG
jgi:hypothetical protein